MLTIEDKPNRPVCSIHGALRWGYYTDTKQGERWVSTWTENVPGLGPVLVPHVCTEPRNERSDPWEPNPEAAERAHQHMAGIRETFGWGPNPFIEKETSDGRDAA